MKVAPRIGEVREALRSEQGVVGLVPTMGATARGSPCALRGGAPGMRRPRCEPVRQPGAVLGAQRPRRVSAGPRSRHRRGRGCGGRPALRTERRGDVPAGLRHLGRARRGGDWARVDASPGSFSRRRDRVSQAVQHRPAPDRLVRAQGRAADRRPEAARARPRPRSSRSASSRRCATRTASRSRRGTRGCPQTSASVAAAIPRALATRDEAQARTVLAEAGIEPEYSPSPISTDRRWPSPPGSATHA